MSIFVSSYHFETLIVTHFVFSDIQKLLKRFNLGSCIYVLISNHIFAKLEVDLDLYRYCALEVCYISGKKSDLVENYLVGSLKTHLYFIQGVSNILT